jgi:hypothetical protein
MAEEKVVCPYEHTIFKADDDFFSSVSTFSLACNGKTYATRSFDDMLGQGRADMDLWIQEANQDHLLEYLQHAVIVLREAIGELEVLRKHCVENHEQET